MGVKVEKYKQARNNGDKGEVKAREGERHTQAYHGQRNLS